jgi:hypothetical protein
MKQNMYLVVRVKKGWFTPVVLKLHWRNQGLI